ncbi:YsnF/AvaK domain-containing protein [Halalkalibacter lacteus]|uniref:YsnF/AvaK domain-containing protein n=1 Tax=Halalkalibacter lacteus TaxID=3090663 RepID=UPI002FCBB987
MGKLILIGAGIGAIIGWIMNISIALGLVLGAIVGGISFFLVATRNNNSLGKSDGSEQTIQIREEQLDIKKERVQTGEVKVHKEVVEEQKTFTVPIRREEMVIEAGSEEELRIPLKEEEIEIRKHPVQVNEVSISKRQIQEMEQVKETLKKETAHFDIKGDVDVKEEENETNSKQ